MSDNFLANTGKGGSTPIDVLAHAGYPEMAPIRVKAQTAEKPVPQQREKNIKDNSECKPPVLSELADISLKFEIDPKTNDVIIMLVDRASRRVVRTIPPEEMSKLDPGELIEMFA